MKHILAKALLLSAIALTVVGCVADGDNSGLNGGTGGGSGNGGGGGSGGSGAGDGNGSGDVTNDNTVFPNEGTVGGIVTDNGTPIAGSFVCIKSAQSEFGATTSVGANLLIGEQLTGLLNMLGGNSATALLNSVADKDLTIDGFLATFSRFALTVGGLSALDSIDQSVLPLDGASVAPGGYAVFAVTFPAGVVDLSIVDNLSVTTFLDDVAQEEVSLAQNALDLLGQTLTGDRHAFIGVKVNDPYDRATIALNPSVLSADVGDAMHVHELCTGGLFVQ